MASTDSPNLNAPYLGVVVLTVLLTFLIHGGAHWMAGSLLGHEMVFGISHVDFAPDADPRNFDRALVAAAGLAVTIVEAKLALIAIFITRSIYAYPALLMAFLFRVLAVVGWADGPNDEAVISEALRIGTWTLPVIVTVFLLSLTISGSRMLKLGVGFNAATLVVVALTSLGLIYLDTGLAF